MVRGLVSWASAMQAVPNTKLINVWNHFKATKGIWVRYVYGVVPVSQYLHTEGVGQWVCSRIGCICLLFHLLKKVGHAANTNMYSMGQAIFTSLPKIYIEGVLSNINRHPCDQLFWPCWSMWIIKIIKKLMILCARSMLRWSEQSTKHRSCSENLGKFCLFYSQIRRIAWLSNMANTFL